MTPVMPPSFCVGGVALGDIDLVFCVAGVGDMDLGVRDDAAVCAWGQHSVSDEYDSKGYGLMRPAGHALGLWPVSSRPCGSR